jgi:putative MATE family efflux protein
MTKIKGFWALLLESLKSEEKEYTSGSINKAIFLLAVPMVLEVLMESVFAVVDIYFVSKISTNAVAVVGLTETMLTLVYSIAIGLSMAATAMVARRIGEKDKKGAAIAAVQAMVLGGIFSLTIGLVGFVFADDLLRLMGASEEMIREGVGYTRIIFTTNIVISFLFLLNGIFRGAGDAAIAMRSLWLANGLNIILDPILIFGWGPIPAMGIEGAAIATCIGRGTGVLYQLYILFRGGSRIVLDRTVFRLNKEVLFRLFKVSLGGMGQYVINSASWIFLARIVAKFGAEALAGYTIAIRIIIFTIMPSWGVGNAASTLVGQNLGAGQPDRAATSVWRAAFINMIFMVTVAILFFTFSRNAIEFFTADIPVVEEGVKALRIICLGYLFYAFGMVVSMAFNGAGDTRTPTIINFVCFWLIQIPMAYSLANYTGLGSTSVYMSIAIAESILAVIAVYLFRRGYWKKTVI